MVKLKKRADGRYQRKLTLSDGSVKVIYGKTIAELTQRENEIRNKDLNGIAVNDKTTFDQWSNTWLIQYKQNSGIRNVTYKMYSDTLRLHITPILGHMRVSEIKPVHCRKVMASVSKNSVSLQHKVLLTMDQIFNEAIQNGMLIKSPTNGFKIVPKKQEEKQKHLSKEQALSMIDNIEEPRSKAFAGLCLFCGLRREEALGLKWEDLAKENNQYSSLTIRRTVTYPANNTPELSDLVKSRSSARTVPIPTKLAKILEDTPKTGEFVITNKNGSIMTRTGYNKLWARVQSATDIPIHAHMLRHTYATSLYYSGIDIRTARQLLGHSSIAMTANIYTHLEEQDSINAGTKLNDYF